MKLAAIARLSSRERLEVAEAVFWLAAARILLFSVPFKQLAPRIGKQNAQTSAAPLDTAQADQARRVARAIGKTGRHVPWDSACLVQAVAADFMLQTRRIPSTLYLGVANDESSNLIAHAWLRCGDLYITGAPQHKRFTIVSTFAPPIAPAHSLDSAP